MCLVLAFSLSAAAEQVLSPIPPAYPLTEDVQAILKVAIQELGYTEGRDGSTKYGQWYGDAKAEWCAEFLCWSVNQAQEELGEKLLEVRYPLYGATNTGRNWFLTQGRYIARTGFIAGWGSQWYIGDSNQMERNSYIPQPGDWVFFSYTPSGDTTHVALVEQALKSEQGQVYVQVIEGNMPDKVQRALYPLEDWRIQGYGTVRDLEKKLAAVREIFGAAGYGEVRLIRDAGRPGASARRLPLEKLSADGVDMRTLLLLPGSSVECVGDLLLDRRGYRAERAGERGADA